MSRQYTKVLCLTEEVFKLKEAGKTNREIGKIFGLTKEQVKGIVKRHNKRKRLLMQGCLPRSKGRPRKTEMTKETRQKNELAQLRMQVELLQNFLLEVGRR